MVREECDSFSADEITDGVMYRRELISRLEVDVVRWTISCSGLDGGVHHEDEWVRKMCRWGLCMGDWMMSPHGVGGVRDDWRRRD